MLVLRFIGFRAEKRADYLAIILFRLCGGENSLDDDEHENEDDFSTSEFNFNVVRPMRQRPQLRLGLHRLGARVLKPIWAANRLIAALFVYPSGTTTPERSSRKDRDRAE